MGAYLQRESLQLTEVAVLVALIRREIPRYIEANSARLSSICRIARVLSMDQPHVISPGPSVVLVENCCCRFRYSDTILTGRGFSFDYSELQTRMNLPVHLVRESDSVKGISLRATRVIYPGDVCARYCGEMISTTEAERRREQYLAAGQVSEPNTFTMRII
jgi:hypothetical protein